MAEHERRKKALAQHLAKGEGGSGMPKIKDGPLVVNWDEGSAATSVEGVREMLKRLEDEARKEDEARSKGREGSGCVIC